MLLKGYLSLLVLSSLFLFSGCSGRIHEVVTSSPPGADIYWGKTSESLKASGLKTTNTRSHGGSEWEAWCYQVKLEGYRDSEVICRPPEGYRYVDFLLEPVRTRIVSDPPDAVIYWGPSADQLKETIYRTPHVEKNTETGANWKDRYFQVKKEGYKDSEILFIPRSSSDRDVSFKLETLK